MSYTKRQFIEAAFDEIGLAADTYDVQPNQLESAMRKLDAMIAMWSGKGIHISWPMPSSPENSNLDSETNTPDYANQAIIIGLAIRLAPSIGKKASPDTMKDAREALRVLQSKSARPIQRQFPGTLPLGAGNKSFGIDNYEFVRQPVERLQVDDDDILEFE